MRLQAALEYLTSYGWAILIIAAVLIAIYSLGFFNIGNYANSECVMTSGFSCSGVSITSGGVVKATIVQSTPSPINITAVGCMQNATVTKMENIVNPPSNQIYLPIGSSYTLSVQCYTNESITYSGTPGSVFGGVIAINYTDEITGIDGIATGQVVSKIT